MSSEIDDIIAGGGLVFRRGGGNKSADDDKVKTKAKKKTYITGAHNSASAKMKAEIRKRRANRPSQRKGQ